MLYKCQRNVIFTLILLLPEKVWVVIQEHRCTGLCDMRTHTHTHASISNKLGVRTFQETYSTVSPQSPVFYDTPLSCVLALDVVFSGGSGAYRQGLRQDSPLEFRCSGEVHTYCDFWVLFSASEQQKLYFRKSLKQSRLTCRMMISKSLLTCTRTPSTDHTKTDSHHYQKGKRGRCFSCLLW